MLLDFQSAKAISSVPVVSRLCKTSLLSLLRYGEKSTLLLRRNYKTKDIDLTAPYKYNNTISH